MPATNIVAAARFDVHTRSRTLSGVCRIHLSNMGRARLLAENPEYPAISPGHPALLPEASLPPERVQQGIPFCRAHSARGDRLAAMRSIHLVIPDLFLPQNVAAEVCAGLALPSLEKLLARAQPEPMRAESLEAWLCATFGLHGQAIAAVALRADKMEPGTAYWLRADPVHLRIHRDQLVLHPDVPVREDEAAQLCASLNAYFAGEGLRFFAPHPQRWYLQLDSEPGMTTQPTAQVAGKNIHAHLPQGQDALRWHSVINEIQMLFHDHAVNQAREARGELPVNSVWLWGGGRAAGQLLRPFTGMRGDSDLAAAFAQAAGIPRASLPDSADDGLYTEGRGDVDEKILLVWEGLRRAIQHGDPHAWRISLQQFEQCCAAPLLDALRAGRIAQLTLDVVQAGVSHRFMLARGAAWKLWRRPKRLAHYALV